MMSMTISLLLMQKRGRKSQGLIPSYLGLGGGTMAMMKIR